MNEGFKVEFGAAANATLGIVEHTAERLAREGAASALIEIDGRAFVARLTPLYGSDDLRYAVSLHRRGRREPLAHAARRFALTPRELGVLRLIAAGFSNRDVADALCIVPATLQNHIRQICAKTGARRRGDLLARVFEALTDPA